jgi:protein SCO1/2
MTKSNRTKVIVVALIVLVAIAAILGMLKFARENKNYGFQPGIHDTLFPNARTIQPFSLRGGDGSTFTEHSLKGHWSVVFFGYTHCPDICPTTMGIMNKVWQQLTPAAQSKIQMVFVSIDPERDSPEAIEKYATYFNPHFQAVTGNETQLKQFSQQVGVAYFKVESENIEGGVNENYIINHTGSLMLFNPLGQYAGVISPPLSVEKISHELERIVHTQ